MEVHPFIIILHKEHYLHYYSPSTLKHRILDSISTWWIWGNMNAAKCIYSTRW